jgi:hypothetical protein
LDLATILVRAGAPVDIKDHARGGVTAEELYRAKPFVSCFKGLRPVTTLRMWQRMLLGESDSE